MSAADEGPIRTSAAIDALRAMGERVTPARTTLLEVLGRTDNHLNAEELCAAVGTERPGVHRATVYRALATLGDLELITHTHVGGSASVYHLATPRDSESPQQSHHAHLQCTVCSRVFDLPAEALTDLATQVEASLSFSLQPQHAALLGLCADCR